MYTPLAIANTIVARHPGRASMGVCKLVYLVQGWTLAVGRPIVGALPEVWRYGPVHRDVYEAYNRFGHDPIPGPQPARSGGPAPVIPPYDGETLSMIDRVVDHYRMADDLILSEIAHAPGSPWRIVAERHGFRVPVGTVVDEALITAHFAAQMPNDQRQLG